MCLRDRRLVLDIDGVDAEEHAAIFLGTEQGHDIGPDVRSAGIAIWIGGQRRHAGPITDRTVRHIPGGPDRTGHQQGTDRSHAQTQATRGHEGQCADQQQQTQSAERRDRDPVQGQEDRTAGAGEQQQVGRCRRTVLAGQRHAHHAGAAEQAATRREFNDIGAGDAIVEADRMGASRRRFAAEAAAGAGRRRHRTHRGAGDIGGDADLGTVDVAARIRVAAARARIDVAIDVDEVAVILCNGGTGQPERQDTKNAGSSPSHTTPKVDQYRKGGKCARDHVPNANALTRIKPPPDVHASVVRSCIGATKAAPVRTASLQNPMMSLAL